MVTMNKANRWIGLSAAVAAFVTLSSPVSARDLTIVGYGGIFQDALRDVFFKPFSDKARLPVKEETYDGGLGILRTKVQGGSSEWDVVDVETAELLPGCEEGLFEKLDWSKIGDKGQFLPGMASDCGMGMVISGFINAYDGAKLKDGPKTWADFFDLNKFPGKRSLKNSPIFTLEVALMADGVPETEVYKLLSTPAGIDRAFKKLDTIKKNTVWWQSYSQPLQLLASGEVVMVGMMNGRVYNINKNEGKNFKIAWNQQILTYDYWVIMKGSPNRDSAYKFLQFYADPQVQKNFPERMTNGMSNKNATALVKKEMLPWLPSNPEFLAHALPQDAKFWLEYNDSLTDRFSKWVAQ